MLKKDIKHIERIITNIDELTILTKNRDSEYFYNSYEMVILCTLVDEIDDSLIDINEKLKNKYKNINWNIISSQKNNEQSLTVGKVWELSSHLLKDDIYNELKSLLSKELPIYYKNYCDKKLEKKNKKLNYRSI